MAQSFICDGCGANVEKPQQIGHVLKRDYCEKCVENAKAFLAAEEDNRAHFCQRFGEIRQQLINVHGKDNFKLPDCP